MDASLDASLDAALRACGKEAWRPGQRQAAAATLAGRDSLLVLPTGGGKSLAFQVRAHGACGGLQAAGVRP